jgi:hypothetical protein
MAAPKRRGPPLRDAGGDPRNCQKLASVDRSNITKSQAKRQESRRSLRAEIYDFVAANPGATFRDIETIPGCRGDYALRTGGGVFLWALSRAAGRAVLDLLQQGLIEARDADPPAYEKPSYVETIEVLPGWRAKAVRVPPLPVVTNHRLWVPAPCWAPTVLHAIDAWAKRADEARAN